MLHSKATTALMRLKEMDRKYNIKRNEDKRLQQSNVITGSSSQDSSIASSIKFRNVNSKDKPQDVHFSLNISAEEKISPKISPKYKVEIRIPTNHVSGDEYSITDNTSLKKSGKISSESSSVIKVDNSIVNKKEDNYSTAERSSKNVIFFKTISDDKLESNKQGSGDSRNNDNSSIITMLSTCSKNSDIILKSVQSVNEHSLPKSEDKSIAKVQRDATSMDSILEFHLNKDDTITEEVNNLTEEKSDAISELFLTTIKVAHIEEMSSKEELKAEYEEDTFEEASTSSESCIVTMEKLKKSSEEDKIMSGVKQIRITPHKHVQSDEKLEIDDDRDKEIVELVPPKVLQSISECDIGLDEELSNYVRRTENIDEVVPISLLKFSKTTPKKHVKRNRRHAKSLNEEAEEKTDTFIASDREKSMERKENNVEGKRVTENDSRTSIKCKEKDEPLQNEEIKEESVDIILPGVKIENEEQDTDSSEDKLLKEAPKKSDVTCTLRKLNKDAINAIVRRQRTHASREIASKSKHGKHYGTVVKLPLADLSKNMEGGDSDTSSIEKRKYCNHDKKGKEKKVKTKRYSKSYKSRKVSNYNKEESKHSRYEWKQIHHRFRKNVIDQRIQQERQDIRNYLFELERTRLEFGPGASIVPSKLNSFKPLEFSKIAAFQRTAIDEPNLSNMNEMDTLRERILTIRQWLKDQYTLYRDYSNLAKAVNSKYIPASLEDAKKTIRQLQKVTIKNR